jgi:hypothetical protein
MPIRHEILVAAYIKHNTVGTPGDVGVRKYTCVYGFYDKTKQAWKFYFIFLK